MRFKGKVAIVTGSTKGLGVQIARRFAEEGANVVITGRSEQEGRGVADGINADGGSAVFIRTDLGEKADIDRLVSGTVEHFGGISVLVNNAAPIDVIAQSEAPIISESEEAFDSIMRIGLYAPVALVKAVLPQMLEVREGAIVNISSVAGVQGISGVPAYSCMKGALQAFTRQVATEYGAQGIRSNCIVTGPILTDNITGMALRHPLVVKAFQQVLLSKDAEMGSPDDIAEACLYLASDGARFVNGVLLPVDGGVTCKSTLPDISAIFAEAGSGAAQ